MITISLFMIIFSTAIIIRKSSQKEQKLADRVETLEARLSLIENKQE